MMVVQQTYTCKCGKKHLLPSFGGVRKCGCGRIASIDSSRKVTITEKSKK